MVNSLIVKGKLFTSFHVGSLWTFCTFPVLLCRLGSKYNFHC